MSFCSRKGQLHGTGDIQGWSATWPCQNQRHSKVSSSPHSQGGSCIPGPYKLLQEVCSRLCQNCWSFPRSHKEGAQIPVERVQGRFWPIETGSDPGSHLSIFRLLHWVHVHRRKWRRVRISPKWQRSGHCWWWSKASSWPKVTRWRWSPGSYLYGVHFTVFTDHNAVCWLMQLKEPTGRLACWVLLLQQYDFKIIHRQVLRMEMQTPCHVTHMVLS